MKGHFGTQLKKAREARGYTQKALGKLIGVSGNSVARTEKGKLGMRWAKLEALVDVLGQPASYYFSGDEPKQAPAPPETRELLLARLILALPPLNKDEISQLVALAESFPAIRRLTPGKPDDEAGKQK